MLSAKVLRSPPKKTASRYSFLSRSRHKSRGAQMSQGMIALRVERGRTRKRKRIGDPAVGGFPQSAASAENNFQTLPRARAGLSPAEPQVEGGGGDGRCLRRRLLRCASAHSSLCLQLAALHSRRHPLEITRDPTTAAGMVLALRGTRQKEGK